LEESVPLEVFKAEVTAWAERLGLRPRSITVRPMVRKWGSCSTAGRLTFDRDLLQQPAAFRAEAIVHELLHLKYPDRRHGRALRALARAYLEKFSAS
jgi:hypothetical protein